MNSSEIRTKFLEFFRKRGHAVIPSAPLVPENDPTVLFNTAGMQPLVPYLLGKEHPAGKRLVDVQKCVRTGDIDDIGDNRHLSFFEMLGNWSLGDYFKKEAINWSYEFLTSKEEGLGLDPNRLYVTVFKGEEGIPRDTDAIAIWQDVFKKNGLSIDVAGEDEVMKPGVRIIPLGTKDNFWIAGTTGPCGGDTEIFYDTKPELGPVTGKFVDVVDSFRLIEIWNNVFMEFNKTAEGTYEKLAKPNVDTGMGLERTTAVINGKDHVFATDLFLPILNKISEFSTSDNDKAKRVVADHIRAAVFMIGDGVVPLNTDQGYVLRRLLRRAVRYADMLGMKHGSLFWIAETVIDKYSDFYTNLSTDRERIKQEIDKEEHKFRQTLKVGLKEFEKCATQDISAANAFSLFSSYGFPIDMTIELAKEKGIKVDVDGFKKEFEKHQELSRKGAEQKFKGGLADAGDPMIIRYHTATHLLHQALHDVLGEGVGQKGSNITTERLRFDFSYGSKMTDEQKKKVEDIINEKIAQKLPMNQVNLPREEAEKTGARHFFGEKYGDQISIYFVGNDLASAYSKEFCGGPHVKNTSELAGPEGKWKFKILKEEAVSQGVRRIKAVLE